MLISCSKRSSNKNLISGHLYVNYIYCPLKASIEQKYMLGFGAEPQQRFF